MRNQGNTDGEPRKPMENQWETQTKQMGNPWKTNRKPIENE